MGHMLTQDKRGGTANWANKSNAGEKKISDKTRLLISSGERRFYIYEKRTELHTFKKEPSKEKYLILIKNISPEINNRRFRIQN